MMKHFKYLIIILAMAVLSPLVTLAAGNTKVTFTTVFSEDINFEAIDEIIIMMDDSEENNYDTSLAYDHDFTYTQENLPNGNIIINDMYVLKDNNGIYNLTYEKKVISDTEVNIQIKVTKNKQKETTTVHVNEAVLGDVFGDDYVNRHTQTIGEYATDEEMPKITSNTQNTSPNGETTNSNGTTNSNDPSNTTSQTTNEYGQTDEDISKNSANIAREKAEKEKEENIKKRNKIYSYILIAFIIIILIVIIFVMIKFKRANK